MPATHYSETKKGGYKPKGGMDKWTDFHAVRAYQYAKDGLTNCEIARAFAIDDETLKRWICSHPVLPQALEEGRKKREGMKTFRAYVYGKLPRELQRLWERINKFETAKRPLEKIQAMMERTGEEIQQHLFLYSLVDCNFIVTQALAKIGLPARTVDKWKADPEFAKMLSLIDEWKGDFFENSLLNLVKSGDTAAIIFANRTFNRKRGYNDKQEIQVGGSIEHKHTFDLEALPLEVRKEIMKSLKAKGELYDPDHLELKPVRDEITPGRILFKKKEDREAEETEEETEDEDDESK